MTQPDPTDDFITRWQRSGAAERANFQQFAVELCDILGVDRPQPSVAEDRHNSYVFEKSVPLSGGTRGRIDLYKRGCFVMEAKQGSEQITTADPFGWRRQGTAVRSAVAWAQPWSAPANRPNPTPATCPPTRSPAGDRLCSWWRLPRSLQRIHPQRRQLYTPFSDPDATEAQMARIRDSGRTAGRAPQAAAGPAPLLHPH